MKKYDDQNENLSLISKIEKIDNRKNMSVSRLKQPVYYNQILSSPFNENSYQNSKNHSKIVNIHSFTDHQVAEINNNNRLMASKLEKAESDIKHLYSGGGGGGGDKQEYLCKQISKHNTKSNLLKKMMSLTKSASDVFSNQPSIDNEMLQQIKISDHNKVKIYEVMEDEMMGENEEVEGVNRGGVREDEGYFNEYNGKLRNISADDFRGYHGKNEGNYLYKEDEKKYIEYKEILNKNKMLAKYMNGKLNWSIENNIETIKINESNLNNNQIKKNSQIDSTNIFYKKINKSSINVSSYNDLLLYEGYKNLLNRNYQNLSSKSPLHDNNKSQDLGPSASRENGNGTAGRKAAPADKHHTTMQTSDSTTHHTPGRSEVSLGALHDHRSDSTLQPHGTAGFNMTMTDLSCVGASKPDLKHSYSSELNMVANPTDYKREQEVDIQITNRQDNHVSENALNDSPSFREE
eukprot:Mrub_02868.p1 GENE.Mrub_02868~~Mrub_02868.p1  ORF type:complete len:505 (-),score=141.39 Mrub_02868:76-1464(-)